MRRLLKDGALASLAGAVLFLGACGGAPATGPGGDPLRPEAKKLAPVVGVEERVPVSKPLAQAPEDCEAVAPTQGLPPKSNKERSIEEAKSYAKQGLALQIESEKTGQPEEIATDLEQAVAKYFTALAADPYNMRATYNLAAAYARIGRNQCALNLLARMAELKKLSSFRADVNEHTDRLFGRGGRWKGKPDPDFDALRASPKFREIAKDL